MSNVLAFDSASQIIDNDVAELTNLKSQLESEKIRLKTLKHKISKMTDRIDELESDIFEHLGDERAIDTLRYHVEVKETRGSVIVTDLELIPPKYKRKEIKWSADKIGLYSALKGKRLPGCELQANHRLDIVKL